MSRRLALAVLSTLALLAPAGCGGEAEEAAPPATTAAPPPPAAVGDEETVRDSGGSAPGGPGAKAEPAPEIDGETLAGGSLSLTDFRGRDVIVHLWSSW